MHMTGGGGGGVEAKEGWEPEQHILRQGQLVSQKAQ